MQVLLTLGDGATPRFKRGSIWATGNLIEQLPPREGRPSGHESGPDTKEASSNGDDPGPPLSTVWGWGHPCNRKLTKRFLTPVTLGPPPQALKPTCTLYFPHQISYTDPVSAQADTCTFPFLENSTHSLNPLASAGAPVPQSPAGRWSPLLPAGILRSLACLSCFGTLVCVSVDYPRWNLLPYYFQCVLQSLACSGSLVTVGGIA